MATVTTELSSTTSLCPTCLERVPGTYEARDDLLAMRDRATQRVDYAGLLGMFGQRGQRLLNGIDDLEATVEDGRVGYVSLVARAE